ncbi:MAG: tetratricopeptide repeat protein [Syntrophobacteraceae bacterium]|jgi:tetratricopeptide (TPR) repeat protein
MDEEIQQQIVDELRIQTAMQKNMNKFNKVTVTFLLIVLVALFVLTPFMSRILSSRNTSYQRPDSWETARELIYRGEYERAEAMLQNLLKKFPDFYYGYGLLGLLYLSKGNLKEAEANYAKAYDLFPVEENQKNLAAVRTVLESKNRNR